MYVITYAYAYVVHHMRMYLCSEETSHDILKGLRALINPQKANLFNYGKIIPQKVEA